MDRVCGAGTLARLFLTLISNARSTVEARRFSAPRKLDEMEQGFSPEVLRC